jgi:hypothetical protein
VLLVAVSAVVALFIGLRLHRSSSHPKDPQGPASSNTADSTQQQQRDKTSWRLLLDFFTGAYLWEQVMHWWKQRPSAQQLINTK